MVAPGTVSCFISGVLSLGTIIAALLMRDDELRQIWERIANLFKWTNNETGNQKEVDRSPEKW